MQPEVVWTLSGRRAGAGGPGRQLGGREARCALGSRRGSGCTMGLGGGAEAEPGRGEEPGARGSRRQRCTGGGRGGCCSTGGKRKPSSEQEVLLSVSLSKTEVDT